MIKFTAPCKGGKILIGLGITSENLGRMAAGKPIHIDCSSLSIKDDKGNDVKFPYPLEIMLMYGRTEEDITKTLEPFIGPDTTQKDSR
jgi:hypothetical protein